MQFGKTLRAAVYEPWKDQYIDYGKLKALLHEGKGDDDGAAAWTEEDENRFCDEIFNVQLEKVARFQQERVDVLKQRVNAAFDRLKELAPADEAGEGGRREVDEARLRELEKELDDITNEVRELKKYSSINYTGFLKIIKKHDRKRGGRYRVRPMMQLSLAQRPFNSEQGYSPLLNKLSIMYFAIRQQLEAGDQAPLDLESQGETHNGERYTAHKFWVHLDNLLEVKMLILRRLPCLIYSEQSAKELDGKDSPATTSLYFDSRKFDLYTEKVDRHSEASSLRLRWYGQLESRSNIFVELKTADAKGNSQEHRLSIKEKAVQAFLQGDKASEKKRLQKMERQGVSGELMDSYRATSSMIQQFVQQKRLSPVLRANYVRTAFQKPADDRVRVSIDTELAFVREDTLDGERPCRDPRDWHRLDIDESKMAYPFRNINQSEVSKFPYAVLEIKLKEDGNRKRPTWVEDLMTSHLVHPAPRFSKFVHGVASLFEDHVNNLPFWLSDLETDIRKDPQWAFEEEEQRRAQRADVMAVGSLIGGARSGSYKAAQSSPVGQSMLSERMAAEARALLSRALSRQGGIEDEAGPESAALAQPDEAELASGSSRGYRTLTSLLPGLSLFKHRRERRGQLPEGVVKPTEWIKNASELKIEPKVWLANERTFLKWQNICILQGSLAIGLYSAASEDGLATAMGVAYVAIAAMAGLWGYWMLQVRRRMIVARSGKDFDHMAGPVLMTVALMTALVINFTFQYRRFFAKPGRRDDSVKTTLTGELW